MLPSCNRGFRNPSLEKGQNMVLLKNDKVRKKKEASRPTVCGQPFSWDSLASQRRALGCDSSL